MSSQSCSIDSALKHIVNEVVDVALAGHGEQAAQTLNERIDHELRELRADMEALVSNAVKDIKTEIS